MKSIFLFIFIFLVFILTFPFVMKFAKELGQIIIESFVSFGKTIYEEWANLIKEITSK